MKKLVTTILLLGAFLGNVRSQTTIYSQNFNSGSASDWSLNTSDLGGDATMTDNVWIINNVYAPGIIGTLTPDEPSGIAGSPESYYLHMNSSAFASFYGLNDNFNASGTNTYFAALNAPISTIGYTNDTFSFWWLCEGDAGAYGKVYYRTSASGSWIEITTAPDVYNFSGSAWTQQKIHLAAFDGAAFLEFGFQFTEDMTGNDPAFGIDDIKLTGTTGSAPPPIASFTEGSTSGCTGNCIQFSSTSTGAITSYSWVCPGATIASSTTDTTTACFATAGTYTMHLYVSNAAGSDSATQTITIHPSPTATISASGPTTFCTGGSVTLISISSGSSLTTHQWYDGSGAIAGATSASYIATTSGTYYVVVSNGFCSTTSASIVVTVTSGAPSDTVTASGPTTFCTGGSVTLSAAAGYTYQWYLGASFLTGATSASYTALAAGTYHVVITSVSCGSTTSLSTTVTVTAGPTAAITASGPTAICSGDTVTLTATAGTGYSYAWYNTGTAIPGATSATYAATMAGMYTVVITNSGGCSTTTATSTTVTINPSPNPVVTRVGHTLSVPNLYTSYQWYKNTVAITGATTFTYTYTVNATYDVKVDSAGCSATSTAVTYGLGVANVSGVDMQFRVSQSGNDAILYSSEMLLENLDASFFDAAGRLVMQDKWMAGTDTKTVHNFVFPDGLYIIKLKGNETFAVIKWMKQ